MGEEIVIQSILLVLSSPIILKREGGGKATALSSHFSFFCDGGTYVS
jgi:hypothetical protein